VSEPERVPELERVPEREQVPELERERVPERELEGVPERELVESWSDRYIFCHWYVGLCYLRQKKRD
jgi:hypothetical protein